MRPSNDREAISLILNGITKAGCTVSRVIDDTWNKDDITNVQSVREAVDLLTGVDEGFALVDLPDGDDGWIYFVLGNSPEEVACNHTVNLSEYIDPITDPWWK